MFKNLTKIVGLAQAALGVAGTASGDVASAVQTTGPVNIFNIASGALMGFLGMKGSSGAAKIGIPTVAGLNGLVGILGLLGVNNVAGLAMNAGIPSSLVNIGISVIGFVSTFMKKKVPAAK
jgi:hypothetical protein